MERLSQGRYRVGEKILFIRVKSFHFSCYAMFLLGITDICPLTATFFNAWAASFQVKMAPLVNGRKYFLSDKYRFSSTAQSGSYSPQEGAGEGERGSWVGELITW